MKRILFIFFPLIVIIFFTRKINAQSLNGIYGIYNNPPNVYAAKIDTSNGNTSIIAPIPFYYGGLDFNSTFTNPYNNGFYYSNGLYIAGFDLNNSTLILNDTFPLPTGHLFLNIAFNACDTSAYGIHYNSSLSLGRLAKYNLSTGSFTDISPYIMTLQGYGNGYSIDLVNQLYVQINGGLLGYDLTTGQLVMNIIVQNVPGEGFIHMVYDCIGSNFYGTSVNNSGSKYFSKIDPVTGIVTHTSNNNLNAYYWKNADALFTIDPFSGIYYYRSGYLISVDVQTGIGTASALNGPFSNMTYFPQCQCNLNTQVAENSTLKKQINIFPNPTSDFITIQYNLTSAKEISVEIFNVYGQPLTAKGEPMRADNAEIKIDMRNFPAGIYFVKMLIDGKEEVRKVVKE